MNLLQSYSPALPTSTIVVPWQLMGTACNTSVTAAFECLAASSATSRSRSRLPRNRSLPRSAPSRSSPTLSRPPSLINKEPFGTLDAISITFISAGTVLVVLYSNHDETAHSLCALLAYYLRTSVISYLGVMGGTALVLWLFIKIMESNQTRFAQRQLFTVAPEDHSALGGARVAPIKGGGAGSSATLPPPPHAHTSATPTSSTDPITAANRGAQRRCCSTNRWLQADANSPALQYMLPFAYAGIGGVMGGLTVLFAKSAAELVVTSVAGSNQFVYYQTYLILGGIFVTGLGQVFYINEGLRRYDALLQ
ncbi:hypothetical protein GGF32_006852, partial [Allomyces javanicus]